MWHQKVVHFSNGLHQVEKAEIARSWVEKFLQIALQDMQEAESNLQLYGDTIKLLQLVSAQAQQQVTKVEDICSTALCSIFANNDLKFIIKTEPKRNGMDTTFIIDDKEIGEVNLMKGEAGASKNIIAAALRLIFAELCSPKVEGPIILDEIGANISAEYQENFGKFLRQFGDTAKRQIILVTHIMPVVQQAAHVVQVSKMDSKSHVQ